MRKTVFLIFLCLIVLICSSCSIQGEKPESGIWYCQELNTAIDFDLYQTTNHCVIVYYDNGNIKINGCHFDYGTGICFFDDSNNNYDEYFQGAFKYNKENEKFVIESYSDGMKYEFIKQEESDSNLRVENQF